MYNSNKIESISLYDTLGRDIIFPHRNEYDSFISTIDPDERKYCAIAGSSVLNALGYINRHSNDLDITVSNKCLSAIKSIRTLASVHYDVAYYPDKDGASRYSIPIKGIKCCVFVLPHDKFTSSVYVDSRLSIQIVKPSFIYTIKREYLNKNLDKVSRQKHQDDISAIERYNSKLNNHKKLINYLDKVRSL